MVDVVSVRNGSKRLHPQFSVCPHRYRGSFVSCVVAPVPVILDAFKDCGLHVDAFGYLKCTTDALGYMCLQVFNLAKPETMRTTDYRVW